jgi:GntR family transcriptional regulator
VINIDPRSSKPIYEQIVDEIKENILKNILQPGDKLPSVRELSSMITANPNTIARAYSELERQRVIETIRGRGTYVSTDYKPKADEEQMERLKTDIKRIIVQTHYMGLEKSDIIDILEEIYQEIEGEQH